MGSSATILQSFEMALAAFGMLLAQWYTSMHNSKCNRYFGCTAPSSSAQWREPFRSFSEEHSESVLGDASKFLYLR